MLIKTTLIQADDMPALLPDMSGYKCTFRLVSCERRELGASCVVEISEKERFAVQPLGLKEHKTGAGE